MPSDVTINIVVSRDLKAWYRDRARKEDRSISAYARRVLEDHRAKKSTIPSPKKGE